MFGQDDCRSMYSIRDACVHFNVLKMSGWFRGPLRQKTESLAHKKAVPPAGTFWQDQISNFLNKGRLLRTESASASFVNI